MLYEFEFSGSLFRAAGSVIQSKEVSAGRVERVEQSVRSDL